MQVPVHLAHVPDYLIPPSLRAAAEAAGAGVKATKKRARGGAPAGAGGPGAAPGASTDPLKSFAYNATRLGGAAGSIQVPALQRYRGVGTVPTGHRHYHVRVDGTGTTVGLC